MLKSSAYNAPYVEIFANQIYRTDTERLSHALRELQALEQLSAQQQGQVNICNIQIRDHERQKRALQIAHQRASNDLDQLENELDKATPDAAAIEVLEEELANAQGELKICEGIFEDLQTQKGRFDKDNRANKDEMGKAQELVKSHKDRLKKAQETVRILQGTREEELKKKNEKIEMLASAEEHKKVFQADLAARQADLAEEMNTATINLEQPVFIPPGQSAKKLENALQRMEVTLEETEKELGISELDVAQAAHEAKEKHHNAAQEYEDIKSLRNVSLVVCMILILANVVQQLITTLNNRRDRWKRFRSGISVRARVMFNYLLSERKFRGTLSIDHKKGLLDIHVSMNTGLM
jgi:chromosome segregation ATPase